jgi:hypothetical protein
MMNNHRKFLFAGIAGLVIGAIIYLSFFSEEPSPETTSKVSVRDARNKTGPDLSVPVMENEPSTRLEKTNSRLGTGDSVTENMDRGLSDSHSEETLDKRVAHRLRDTFPDNLALPALTAEKKDEKQKAREERNLAYGQIAANRASEKQIHAYYDDQIRLTEDSIQILEFILYQYKDELSERSRKKHEYMLERFQQRLEIIPQKEKEVLSRLSNKKQVADEDD